MTDQLYIGPLEMTADQLARPDSDEVMVQTKLGEVIGGRVKNGVQVFLNVPYGLDVPRWTDPQPLPDDYDYGGREYTKDALYCAQPTRFYTQHVPVRERLGLGQPTENPFFADIYIPSHVRPGASGQPLLPVRVFIHGGFMQFGSTSGQHYNQQFFATEQFGEVRVLLGHRLSVLGLLGSSNPEIAGNYAFKDCWLGLEWVQEHIASFGGDPEQVHLSGLSGGAHIVGQLVHRAARLAPSKAPFITALLQSNAVLTDPVHPSERSFHVEELCQRLGIDHTAPDVLEQLRDTSRVSTEALIAAVQGDGDATTYRGIQGTDGWLGADMMGYQRSGGLARGLREAGVKCIIAGDVRDEVSFYRTVHPCETKADLKIHLDRFYPEDTSRRLLAAYPPLPDSASPGECDELLGRIFADCQVHLPVRLMLHDLAAHGFPTVQYAVEMVADKLESRGVVSHGSDLVIQHYRLSMLSVTEAEAALRWHNALDEAVSPALMGDGSGFLQRAKRQMLLLTSDGETRWAEDWRWPQLRPAEKAIRG